MGTAQQRSPSFPIVVKKASELRGLTFGNKIDEELLPSGLVRNTLTFLYGDDMERTMNMLCAESVRMYGGSAIYVDASNSADPYLIAKLAAGSSSSKKKKNSALAEKMLDSILIVRAFTCYQLYDIVAKQLGKLIKERKPISIFVSGIGSVFNEQDNSKEEIERLQTLIASRLRDIADDKENGVQFVVASSRAHLKQFVSESRTAIKFSDGKALLAKADHRRYAQVRL